jgi:DNA polymerase
MSDRPSSAAADLLAWYSAMGVDVAVEEVAANRLAPRPAAPPPTAVSGNTVTSLPDRKPLPAAAAPRATVAPAVAAPPAEVERAARSAAAAAGTLDELRVALDAFEGCNLRLTATQLVFADGNPEGRVMLVGEAPGRDEDIQGLPFVGRSGQLLDRMLAAIGLDRTKVYIANVVPWRPPGNRTPTPQETAACRPFIQRQIELADPDFLICLGGPAAAELMANREGILKFRGRWHEYDTGRRKIRAMATLHPAYLLRQPLQKRLAWRDFLALKAALDETA